MEKDLERLVKINYCRCLLNYITDRAEIVEYIIVDTEKYSQKKEIEKMVDCLMNDNKDLTKKAEREIRDALYESIEFGYCDTETMECIIEDMLESNIRVNINKAVDLFYKIIG